MLHKSAPWCLGDACKEQVLASPAAGFAMNPSKLSRIPTLEARDQPRWSLMSISTITSHSFQTLSIRDSEESRWFAKEKPVHIAETDPYFSNNPFFSSDTLPLYEDISSTTEYSDPATRSEMVGSQPYSSLTLSVCNPRIHANSFIPDTQAYMFKICA